MIKISIDFSFFVEKVVDIISIVSILFQYELSISASSQTKQEVLHNDQESG